MTFLIAAGIAFVFIAALVYHNHRSVKWHRLPHDWWINGRPYKHLCCPDGHVSMNDLADMFRALGHVVEIESSPCVSTGGFYAVYDHTIFEVYDFCIIM